MMCPEKDVHLDGMNRAVAQRLSRCSSCRFSSAMAVRGWPRSLAAKNGHGTVVLDVHSWNGTHLECCPMFSDVSHTRSYHAIFLMASGAFSGKMSAESLCDLIPPSPVVWGRPSNYGFGEVAHLGECHYNYLISDNGPRRSHCMTCDDV